MAAHTTISGGQLALRAIIALLDCSTIIASQMAGPAAEAERLGNQVADRLLERGGILVWCFGQLPTSQ
ncbi:MAG: hypothetical protein IT211_08005 [Armatimonadetes bacterium]|nr:hypothetical protein [Armatimonadota bacterium]